MSEKQPQENNQPPTAPAPGSPEYDAQMAQKYEQRTGDVKQKPEGIPDKFWNAEKGEVDYAAMAKSYTELEKLHSQRQQQQPPAEPPKDGQQQQQQPPKDGQQPPDAVAKALTDAGLSFDAVQEEFVASGDLAPETRDKLKKVGYTDQQIDIYLNGVRAASEKLTTAAHEAAGGADAYADIVKWAGTTLTPAQVAAYNASVSSSDPEQIRLAVAGLRAQYDRANGTDPKLLGGSGGGDPVLGFRSRAEQTAALNKRDERGRRLYDIDTAYRRDVEAKIAASKF